MVGSIIQARMESTRLPGKVLKDIYGKSMLARVVERTAMAETVDTVIVATTTHEQDNPITQECKKLNIPVFRGSSEDVLDRYYQAAKKYSIDTVVRITSDCPLIDPEIIDMVVNRFIDADSLRSARRASALPQQAVAADSATRGTCDYCTNVMSMKERTFPRGLDVEVIAFNTLEKIAFEITEPEFREHVTVFIRENPEKFRVLSVKNKEDFSHYRWTVDRDEELTFVRSVYSHLGSEGDFTWHDVLSFLSEHPELSIFEGPGTQKAIKGKIY